MKLVVNAHATAFAGAEPELVVSLEYDIDRIVSAVRGRLAEAGELSPLEIRDLVCAGDESGREIGDAICKLVFRELGFPTTAGKDGAS